MLLVKGVSMDMRSIEVLFVFALFFDGAGNVYACRCDDDDCFYYHPWRNNVVIAFGTLSSFLT